MNVNVLVDDDGRQFTQNVDNSVAISALRDNSHATSDWSQRVVCRALSRQEFFLVVQHPLSTFGILNLTRWPLNIGMFGSNTSKSIGRNIPLLGIEGGLSAGL